MEGFAACKFNSGCLLHESSFPGGTSSLFCFRAREIQYDAHAKPQRGTLPPAASKFRKKRPVNRLFSDSKFLDNVFVTFGIVRLQIVQQTASLADHHKQTAPGGMVLLVVFEVLSQLPDTLAQDCNLNFRTPGI